MTKDRYAYLCRQAEAGRDPFASHPGSMEEGLVTSCITRSGHLVVATAEGHRRCWDYRDCEELRHAKSGPLT